MSAPCADLPLLYHYRATPIAEELVFPVKQTPREGNRWTMIDKPRGLWVSPDDEEGWAAWCKDENFRVQDLTFKYRVTLNPKARYLWVKTQRQLTRFYRTYEAPIPYSFMKFSGIDWDSVANEYDAIFIIPYRYESRLTLMWYYGWDCASGCIWSEDAIEKIELVESIVP